LNYGGYGCGGNPALERNAGFPDAVR